MLESKITLAARKPEKSSLSSRQQTKASAAVIKDTHRLDQNVCRSDDDKLNLLRGAGANVLLVRRRELPMRFLREHDQEEDGDETQCVRRHSRRAVPPGD
jgi:hypothetical protein